MNASKKKAPEDKDEQIKVLMSYIRFLEDRLFMSQQNKLILKNCSMIKTRSIFFNLTFL